MQWNFYARRQKQKFRYIFCPTLLSAAPHSLAPRSHVLQCAMASMLMLECNDIMLPKSIHDALRQKELDSADLLGLHVPNVRYEVIACHHAPTRHLRCYNDTCTGHSHFLPRRHLLVDWLHDLGKAFKLHVTTVHSSVYLIDTLMDQIDSASQHDDDFMLSHQFVQWSSLPCTCRPSHACSLRVCIFSSIQME